MKKSAAKYIALILCAASLFTLASPAKASNENIPPVSIAGEWFMFTVSTARFDETTITGNTFEHPEHKGTYEIAGKSIILRVDVQSPELKFLLIDNAGIAFLHDDDYGVVAMRDKNRDNVWIDFSAEFDVVLFAENSKMILKGNKNVGEYLYANGQLFLVEENDYSGGTVYTISNDAFYVNFDIAGYYDRLYFVRSKSFE